MGARIKSQFLTSRCSTPTASCKIETSMAHVLGKAIGSIKGDKAGDGSPLPPAP